MKNRYTVLLVICALLLGINIGLLLSGQKPAAINVLPSATAGSPVLSARDSVIYTTSQDGTRLYEWKPKSSGTTAPNPWIATAHSL